MSRISVITALLATSCLLLAGCEEQGASAPAASSPQPEDNIVAAWQEAGLETTEFKPMAGAGIAAGTCFAGQVAKLDTVLCRYADPAAAKAAKPAGLTYIGETTGLSEAKGVHLLVIADRNKDDPAGKTINKAAKAFLNYSADKKPDDTPADEKPAADEAAGKKPSEPGK